MPQSLSGVYIHIVFGTRDRKPFIRESFESELYSLIGAICQRLECNPVQIGGCRNHVHILCRLSRKIALMELIQEVKQQSSKWVKRKFSDSPHFYWQSGYGVFSVSASGLQKVKNYIRNQHRHHKKVSFEDEFRALLVRYKVDYDEAYFLG
jgi:putative transposase